MLIIRLQRVGRKNDPSFRVVVTESKNAAKSGKFLEIVGSYDARQGRPELDRERIAHWLKQGVQVSDTVHNLLVKEKVIEGASINMVPAKAVSAEPAPAATAAAPASSEPAAPAEEASESAPAEEAKAE